MKIKALRIHPMDNVEVALSGLYKGEMVKINGDGCILPNDIPAKHKYATCELQSGDDVMMYGVLVGRATKPISKGELITVNNIRHATNDYSLKQRRVGWDIPDVTSWENKTFMGFKRGDGSFGVANYWLVIPLVFCENKNIKVMQEAFIKELGYESEISDQRYLVRQLTDLYQSGKTQDEILATNLNISDNFSYRRSKVFPNVDGIKFLTHSLGCGGTKEDAVDLCGLLAGYITHPNVAGATVLSLGCQNAQIELLNKEIELRDNHFSKPLYILEQQQIGNETVFLREAVKKTFVGLMEANKLRRTPAPIGKLSVGLECGGSDGFSGISANPALGYASDLLVALGASVILSEFPELCGVEQEMSDRCIDESLAIKFMKLMTSYYTKAKMVGSGFDSNPSAGNIRDGLITDGIKSAGAARKGGTSPVRDVLDYPEKIKKTGLNLLCTPGSDIESTTAEVGAGATLVLFTTGLGTPTGNPIAPVVKISTNSALFTKMNDIIDLDAGAIITGKETIKEVGERILEYVVKLASGEVTAKADTSNHDDFIPWKRGISL